MTSVNPSVLKRKFFSNQEDSDLLPNLIETQKISYDYFLNNRNQDSVTSSLSGLEGVLKSTFPIHSPNNTASLEFIDYEIGEPKFDVEECKKKSISYSAPLWVSLRLILWEFDSNLSKKEVISVQDQKVYFGDIPLMTDTATFVINGIERVVVSQMHRSPGVFFDNDKGRNHSSGRYLYSARIIPYRGSWLDFEFDIKDLLYFRIDKKKKLYVTTLLRALGMKNDEILDVFYNKMHIIKKGSNWITDFKPDSMKGFKLSKDLVNAEDMSVISKAGTKLTPRMLKKFETDGVRQIVVTAEDLQMKFIAQNIVNNDTGEVYFEAGDELTADSLELIETLDVKSFAVLKIELNKVGPYIRDTMFADRVETKEDALLEIYRVIRPGEIPNVEAAETLFHNLFFDKDRYDLSPVGRVKLNGKLNLNYEENVTYLTKDDVTQTIKKLVEVKDGEEEIDDIDHLSNRRVRSVGELMENQIRIGLVRFEKNVIEKMLLITEKSSLMPQEFVSSKMISNIIKDFFGSSQLSQFMDQTNPLSEITHKRRLSALGPGGLSRERASFEVRDVHNTHYGRICPIETPEGQNIGLISSMASYARVNKYGFIETPYRKVKDGVVTHEVEYLNAIEESKYVIAQASVKLSEDNRFESDTVNSRKKGEVFVANSSEVDYVHVSYKQIVSVAASLIPFLENDDANRALMGSNMQRQAVPLVYTEAPFVGTGMEKMVARDSGALVLAKRDGVVQQVDSTRIVIKANEAFENDTGVDIYNLRKYQRSNHNTCINQVPIVSTGTYVKAGDVIADGPCTDRGELALGKNVLVAFMPWNGYNFEDSILISETVVADDVFTSIHIEELEVYTRDTRLGPEEITRDIPSINEHSLRQLDECGIVHIGAEVKAGDILVGKVTPKSESPMTAEEKLLKAIFGEKASDVRDSSLRLPPGVTGTVVNVQVYTRRGIEKNSRALVIEREEIENLAKDKNDKLLVIESFVFAKAKELLLNQVLATGNKVAKAGTVLTEMLLEEFSKKRIWEIQVEDISVMNELEKIRKYLEKTKTDLENKFNEKSEKIRTGDDLPQGALKVVKVFVATKQKLQPGDKMAGRHGNKGVVSRILPKEDMPYLEDGTVVDIVLNPLGVPSRMNVGQILETHLGWAAAILGKKVNESLRAYHEENTGIETVKNILKEIYDTDKEFLGEINDIPEEKLLKIADNLKKGVHFATPVFNGAKEKDINDMLEMAGLDDSGQARLIDGRTGEYFDRSVTVGYIYMLKLHHLVEDKIHARSVGPYSLVTQQPLGGKSHFGGQRFGEMECWALQAYGAAFTLQEMLTVKSDDVTGRVRMYESIIRGDQNFESGIPESFHVMVKELKALGLNLELKKDYELSGESTNVSDFDKIRISIASPEEIRKWSHGEVTKAETINYRTLKPEKDGLFCARIFGPVKDYECLCGKYKRMKYKGTICEKCGVEVIPSKVRRERMGHIELAAPVIHPWFFNALPSRISMILDISLKDLEKVVYFESYMVVDPGFSPLNKGDLINEEALSQLQDQYGEDSFTVKIGAEAVKIMLADLNLEEEKKNLRAELVETNSDIKRKKIVKRLKLIEDFICSGNKPEWMVLEVMPVIPPELRPLVMLDGGRFATSDANELYRGIINRNNRLKKLMELRAPEIIIRSERRMLQASVIALIDNKKTQKHKRVLKSLSDNLKGKQGRFRQNLLGKRVDYSGRSVIVVGPELKLHQCGLPKKMALELFKPFVLSKLELLGMATTIKAAKKLLEAERPEVFDILEEVIREHPVLLNRAPTLHRLGIQAFEPVLIEGKAIQLHPLVCSAFNADFDGDQMAVHVPLSIEAQIEARVLMMSTNNILSPSNGKPIIVPSQDIVLGLYYLSLEIDGDPGEGMVFAHEGEIAHALESKIITLHSKIKCRREVETIEGHIRSTIVETTAGRIALANLLPKEIKGKYELVNQLLTKKDISNLIDVVYRHCKQKKTVIFADRLMSLGFDHACRSGISFGKNDIIIPKSKDKLIEKTVAEKNKYETQFLDGVITEGEKRNKLVDAWTLCSENVASDMMEEMSLRNKTGGRKGQEQINSIFMMAHSGARSSLQQLRQLGGMRGLMTKPSGEIIETPIISNFKEGLTELEYFISTHGARKGLADMALKTANSGYLTRRLVDVAQDCIIIMLDCNTKNSILISSSLDGRQDMMKISDKILGRTSATEVRSPLNNDIILKEGQMIDEDTIDKIEVAGIDALKVRSVLTCEAGHRGVCARCYGRDLSTGDLVSVGEAVGVVAAQSIGEPGTQLTMRTFHGGGTATKGVQTSSAEAPTNGVLKIVNLNTVANSEGKKIVMSRNCEAAIINNKGDEKFRVKIPYGAKLHFEHDSAVKKGDKIADWDPYIIPIITEKTGRVKFNDMVESVTVKEVVDEVTGISSRMIIDHRHQSRTGDLRPRIMLVDGQGNNMKLANGLEARYFLPVNAILNIEDDTEVHSGDVLARIPLESTKTKDIVGGLPRVAELFEARKPKDHAIISEAEGIIEFGKDYKSKRRLIIKPKDSAAEPIEYLIPKGKHIAVNEGDYVSKGDLLMDGNLVPHDILRIMGVEALAHYMVSEVQQVYLLQGMKIDDKHIETILRQMLQKVEVEDPGDTVLLTGEQLSAEGIKNINEKAEKENLKPASYKLLLQGITKASLQTDSFISAASFQETTRVLTEAAVAGKIDPLEGIKENVIVGRLIPAGTGFYVNKIKATAAMRDKKITEGDDFKGTTEPIEDFLPNNKDVEVFAGNYVTGG